MRVRLTTTAALYAGERQNNNPFDTVVKVFCKKNTNRCARISTNVHNHIFHIFNTNR